MAPAAKCDLFMECKDGSIYNVDDICARLMERGQMIILADVQKVSDKSQFSSWLKMLNKREMEGSHLNVASAICEKRANTICDGERLKVVR